MRGSIDVVLLRRALRISQRNFAQAIGVSVLTVQRWESYRRTARRVYQDRMAEVARDIDDVIFEAAEASLAAEGDVEDALRELDGLISRRAAPLTS